MQVMEGVQMRSSLFIQRIALNSLQRCEYNCSIKSRELIKHGKEFAKISIAKSSI